MSKKKLEIVILCGVILICGVTAVVLHTLSDNRKNQVYLEGLDAYEKGDYAAARKSFESIGNYEDTTDILREIDYQEALLAIEQGDDAAAEKVLLTMKNYKDAENYLYLITYHKVKACMEAGDYDQAEVYADQITGYEDVEQLKQEIYYQQAWKQIDAVQFDKAKELLAKVSDADRVESTVASINWTQYAVPCLQDLYSRYTEGTKISDVLEAKYCPVTYNTGLSIPMFMFRYTVVTETGDTVELYAGYNNDTYFGACHTLDRTALDMQNQAEMSAFLEIQPNWNRAETLRLSAPAMKTLSGH